MKKQYTRLRLGTGCQHGELMSLVTSSQKIIVLGIIVSSITVFGIAVVRNIILGIQILSVSK